MKKQRTTSPPTPNDLSGGLLVAAKEFKRSSDVWPASQRFGVRERWLIVLATPPLMVLCVGGIVSARAAFGKGHAAHGFDAIAEALFAGLLGAFALFCGGSFVTALFAPRQLPRVAAYLGAHAWQAIVLFFAVCGGVVLVVFAAEAYVRVRRGL